MMDPPDNYQTTYDSKTKIVVFYSKSTVSSSQVIQDLVRQVKSMERDREQTTNRLRNTERDVLAINRRLEESGVHLETERKMERSQQELRMQMSELQNKVLMQRQSGVTESVYSDDVLSTLTRDLQDL